MNNENIKELIKRREEIWRKYQVYQPSLLQEVRHFNKNKLNHIDFIDYKLKLSMINRKKSKRPHHPDRL